MKDKDDYRPLDSLYIFILLSMIAIPIMWMEYSKGWSANIDAIIGIFLMLGCVSLIIPIVDDTI